MHNISKGRIGEYLAISKFLDEGLSVYQDFVDIRGVDFIVLPRTERENEPLKIQVKATDSDNKAFRIPKDAPEADYFFLINTESEEFWIIPDSKYPEISEESQSSSSIKDMMFKPWKGDWKQYEGFEALSDIVKRQDVDFHASRKGKQGEAIGMSYFLRNGIEVYDSLADVSGIDIVIRDDERLYDVQIKYSSSRLQYRNVKKREASPDYLFLFIQNADPRQFYLMPSDAVWEHANDSGGIYLNKELREKYRGLSFF